MIGKKIEDIKIAVTAIIKEARGFLYLSDSDVKFESIKKVNNSYEIIGSYEYRTIFGEIRESGRFKIVIDENLDVISAEITPTRERSQ